MIPVMRMTQQVYLLFLLSCYLMTANAQDYDYVTTSETSADSDYNNGVAKGCYDFWNWSPNFITAPVVSEEESQRFLWLYLDPKWSVYISDFHTILNQGIFEFRLQSIRYDANCRKLVCIAEDTWMETGEIHEFCCEYNGVWYLHGKPVYKNDCVGYVCVEGEWMMTNYTDPMCCQNKESVEDSYRDLVYWWRDYDFNENEWDDDVGGPSDVWYRINKTRIGDDLVEVKCVARDTWVPTRYLQVDGDAPAECEFNGKRYNHTERLPGCLKVYCINGKWLQSGYIDSQCKKCYARWDPHLGTFDGSFYSYHGNCNYAFAQEGTSYTPSYGVFSHLYECWNAACVGPSTYIDSPGTVIEMGRDGRYTPQLHTLYVNGVSYTIPNNLPQPVMEGSIVHPVMAWRYGNNCIRLLGTSKISVQKCGSSLDIWVSPDLNNTLYGLCGFYDGNQRNNFTKRDRNFASSSLNDFADSWETTGNCFTRSGGRVKRTTEEEDNACNTDNSTRDALHERCMEMAQVVGGNVTEEELTVMMDDCMFDMCSIYTNTSGDQAVLGDFMTDIVISAAEIVDVELKTTDNDVLPAPLRSTTYVTTVTDDLPSVSNEHETNDDDDNDDDDDDDDGTPGLLSFTEATGEPANPNRPPLIINKLKPTGSKCDEDICSFKVEVHVNVGNP